MSRSKKSCSNFKFLSHFSLIFIVCLLFLPAALAHVPLTPGENDNIETATYINDPVKSWAVYTELHEGGEAQYYRLDLNEGQRLFAQLFTPAESEFTPEMAIIGPFGESHTTEIEEHEHTDEEGVEAHEHEHTLEHGIPDFVAVPKGAEVMTAPVEIGEVTYEPFSPGSLSELGKVDFEVPTTGIYYVAVYSLSTGGKYGLAIGYLETWSLLEWIQIPIAVLGVHQWEGQSIGFILAPLLAIVAIGLGLLVWRYKITKTPSTFYGWIGSIAGLLYLGSGAIIITQMAIALSVVTIMPQLGWITVTIIFALMPIISGVAALILTVRRKEVTTRKRIYLFIIGIVALFVWAGLLIGPALAILASALPIRNK